jgi:hypothetical protein
VTVETQGGDPGQAPGTPPAQAAPSGNPPMGQAPTGQQAPANPGDGLTAATARELEEARKEAARYRTELRKFEAAEEARKAADMTEAQRAAAQATKEAERATKLQAKLVARTVEVAALAAGFHDPADAYLHISGQLEMDEDGEPKPAALKKALEALAAAKPYLVKPSQGATAGQPAPVPTSPANPARPAIGATNNTIAQPGQPAGSFRWPRLSDSGLFSE